MLNDRAVSSSVIANRVARVHLSMAVSVLISLVSAYLLGTNTVAVQYLAQHWPLQLVMIAVPFILLILFSVAGTRIARSWPCAAGCMVVFSVAFGLCLSGVFASYAFTTIVVALLCTIAMFICAAAYGFFTKRVLDSLGDFLIAALVVLIIVSVINLLIGSSLLTLVISCVAVLVYLGLTVFDSYQVKLIAGSPYYTASDELYLVINLYLDFVGMFVNLLTVLGDD